jgi:hypothetical protein
MSYTDALCALEYEQESSWGENVSTFATHRIPLTKPIDVGSLMQEGMDPGRNVSQLQGGTTWFPGVKDGTFTTTHWLHGHGGATSGAVTIDPLETFHGFAWGNPSLAEANAAPTRSAASGTTVAAGSTTTAVNTVASGTIARGSLVRIGTSGLSADTRGGGQFYQVNNHTGTVLTTRNALIAAPNAADVVHVAVNLYMPETVGNSQIKSWRGRVLTPANQRYILRGMYPKAIKLDGLAGGQFATIGYDWGVTSFVGDQRRHLAERRHAQRLQPSAQRRRLVHHGHGRLDRSHSVQRSRLLAEHRPWCHPARRARCGRSVLQVCQRRPHDLEGHRLGHD